MGIDGGENQTETHLLEKLAVRADKGLVKPSEVPALTLPANEQQAELASTTTMAAIAVVVGDRPITSPAGRWGYLSLVR